jgi:hypothetical protein
MSGAQRGLVRLVSPCTTINTGYPWADGDILYAADLNAAFLPVTGGTVTGPLVLPNLPTSNAGLAPGTLWNNAGVVCVA